MGDKAMTYSNGKMKRVGDTDTVDFDGNVNLGNADSDNIVFQGEVASNILPNVTETYNLGSADKMWAKGYFESITQRDVKVAKYSSDGTQQRFIRFNTSGLRNVTTANFNNFFIREKILITIFDIFYKFILIIVSHSAIINKLD